jgi:transcriptional regulator with XRE-family HTH domain
MIMCLITDEGFTMPNSAKALAKNLSKLTESEPKQISKTQLSEKSGIGRSSLDAYIKEQTIPQLDVLDRIANALGANPEDLIRDEDRPLVLAHTLKDCLETITKALNFSAGFEPNLPSSVDPITQEIESILATFDEVQRAGLLVYMRSIQRGAAAHAILREEQKKKTK